MKLKQLLLALIALIGLGTVSAQQPYSGCWHPDFIKDWTPEKDVDAKFNKSSIPLQKRFKDLTVKANQYQFYDGQVAACLTMNPSASTTPSQGANNFIGYNPTYWQYMDLLIWWGGSAGEGIILPPSAPVIDAAHLSGVKVLGQVFFPPGAFGGQVAWVKQMLTKEGSEFPYAKKMYEIAKYYGFDGWFINEETGGASKAEWTDFVKYYLDYAKADGDTNQEIQWYDMGTSIGSLMDMMKLDRTSYFLNYGSPSTSNITSQTNALLAAGLTQEEVFRTAYFGVEQAQGGIGGNASYFKNLFPNNGHKGSIDIFNPEEGIWKKPVESLLGTPNASGEQAYTAMNTVFRNEARFWTNLQNDPSNTTSRNASSWPGLANAMMERTTISSLPFITTFSAGLGKARYVNGESKGTQDWYHRGMQTIMPTWRWWFDSNQAASNALTFDLNWDDAYNIGTSVKVTGKLAPGATNTLRLYKTQLPIKAGDKFQLVYKTSVQGSINLKMGVAENSNAFTSFELTETATSNGWTIAEVDLSSLAGKTVSIVALGFDAKGNTVTDYAASLGQLGIYPSGYSPATTSVTNLKVENKLAEDGGDIRLVWDRPTSNDLHHFNIYMDKNGGKQLVGQTRGEGFYIPKFARNSATDLGVKIYISTVNKRMEEGSLQMIESLYPALTKPMVKLKASKTLVKKDEEVTVTATATNFPTAYTWDVPANATLVKQENNTATFKFSKEGFYNVKVSVANTVGATEYQVEELINVSETTTLDLVSVGKKIHAVSGFLPPEGPEWLIDGVQVPGNVRNKWCIGGSKEHWVIIDLQQSYDLYSFSFFDCGNKENSSDNVKFYKVYTATNIDENNEGNWTLVLDEVNRPEDTKVDFVKPTTGRYVKFVPYDPETPITIRIWEFEAYGIKAALKPDIDNITVDKSFVKTNEEVTFEASVANAPTTYTWSVTPAESATLVSQTANKATFKFGREGVYSVTLKAENALGTTSYTKEDLVEVSDTKEFEIISVGKKIHSFSSSTAAETPNYLIDGTTAPTELGEKWCALGNNNYWVIVDLEKIYENVARFKFYDCNSLEAYENVGFYRISVATDIDAQGAGDWKLVVDAKNKSNLNIKDDITEATAGRYVKFEVYKPNVSDFTIRIFEFEVYNLSTLSGIDNNQKDNDISVYPNPVNAGDNIHVEGENLKSISLISLQGTLLLQQNNFEGGRNSVSTAGLSAGTYILRVVAESGVKSVKVIVK